MVQALDGLTPDDIGLEFVPRLEPELEVITLENERVVLGESGRVVSLNATASLIFDFLDGDTSLAELVDDFTEALGADRSVVETDVVSFVRDLGVNGFLVGVRTALPSDLPFEWKEVVPLEVGEALDDFTLPLLDGDERSLTDYRGGRMLLVNWSPGCGFCVRIASELADLAPKLAEHDVTLAFVTVGDADANRTLNDRYGLTAPMWLRDGTGVDPFVGTGTPAAFLLDADGTLVESMSVGADQVPRVARNLARIDDTGNDVDPREGDEGVRYLPAPGAMCGPGGGAGPANSTDWQGTRAYALGEHHVGVRYDDTTTAETLDRLFLDARVDDPRAPDNYSVALGGTRTTRAVGASRSLKLLVQGGTQLVRSRSAARVLAALLQHLSVDLQPTVGSLTNVSATALVRDGEAFLLPSDLSGAMKQLQPRLAKVGLAVVDTPRTRIDIETRELVVPEPVVPYDASLLTELDADVRLGNELPCVRPGRYPLRAWFLARSDDVLGPLTPGIAVAAAVPQLFSSGVREEVEQLADLFGTVTPYGIWFQSADELVDQIVAADL